MLREFSILDPDKAGEKPCTVWKDAHTVAQLLENPIPNQGRPYLKVGHIGVRLPDSGVVAGVDDEEKCELGFG